MKIKHAFSDYKELSFGDWSVGIVYITQIEEWQMFNLNHPILRLYKELESKKGGLTLTLFDENLEQIWWKNVTPEDRVPFEEARKELKIRKEMQI